ncbi:unnamed protein product [Camellia sinensis]
MSAQKKRNFQIEAFKHRVVVDPKYAEKTWKILEHAIQEIYNHKIGCVLSLSLSLSPWAHCLHCLVSTTCSSGFRVILCLNRRLSSFSFCSLLYRYAAILKFYCLLPLQIVAGVPRWENESAFCKHTLCCCRCNQFIGLVCVVILSLSYVPNISCINILCVLDTY